MPSAAIHATGPLRLCLAGIPVEVDDPHGLLWPHLERLYAHAISPTAGTPLIRISVNTDCRKPTEPPEEPVMRMQLDRPLRAFLLHDNLWMSDGRNATWVDYARGELRVDLATRSAAALYLLAHHAFPIALGELLRVHGRYALHAGMIATRDGGGRLLVGDSDAGKSTLCYRARALGHRLVADDGLLLYAEGERLYAAPFYREFCLDPALIRDEDRPRTRQIEPSVTGPRHRVELELEAYVERAPIDQVWLLRRDGAETSRLEPALPSELLAELARQNQRLLLRPALAAPHLALLGRLATEPRGLVAQLGSDILSSDAALEALLAP